MGNFSYVLTALAAYLLGSIPTGYLVARAKGIDIRKVGSGNMGATNVFRVLGKTAGIFVLVIDGLKGWAACELVSHFVLQNFVRDKSFQTEEYLKIIAGLSAILGHNYTCWLKFKGGKGVATSAGVLAALFPKEFFVCVAIWAVIFVLSRYVSLASVGAAITLPITAWYFERSPAMEMVALFMGALAVYKHKANIQRLLNGTENRVGQKKETK